MRPKVFSLLMIILPLSLMAQPKWKKSMEPTEAEMYLFQSTQTANFQTTTTPQKGDFKFEISHRFANINGGFDRLWGVDGPATIRLAFGYSPFSCWQLALGRSNLDGNWDLWVKWRFLEIRNEQFPNALAVRVGGAWNSTVKIEGEREKTDSRNFQGYAQLIWNVQIKKKLSLGIVPSYLYNSHVLCKDVEYSFTLGDYITYYITSLYNIFAEWNPTISGWRDQVNSYAFGVGLETGGHSFKIFVTNNNRINPSQYLAGSPNNDLRFAFNITRAL